MSAGTLAVLRAWAEEGRLRRLDAAMAAFVLSLDPQATPTVLLAVAVLTHLEGQGHTSLPLTVLAAQGEALLSEPSQPQAPVTRWPGVWHDQLAPWVAALQACAVVRCCLQPVPAGGWLPDTGQPLVLAGSPDHPMLYLRRHWMDETTVAQNLATRAAVVHTVDTVQVRDWLGRLFPAQTGPATPDWQQLACALAARGGVTVLTGGPGTGKTYTAARLLALLWAIHPEPLRLKVGLAAPTGKAAARLRSAIDQALVDLGGLVGNALDLPALSAQMGAARTLHAWLGARPDTRRFRHGPGNPLDLDVLLLDETSMVHLEMMAALLRALPAQTRLVLLGDKDQLASVEAGSVLGELCAQAGEARYSPDTCDYLLTAGGGAPPPPAVVGGALEQQTVMLRHSRRFGSGIGRLAQAINQGVVSAVGPAAVPTAQADASVWWAPAPIEPKVVVDLALKGRPWVPASYAGYLERMREPAHPERLAPDAHADWASSVLQAYDTFRILCAVHGGPWGVEAVNQAVETALASAGWLQPTTGWYPGRPVMVTRNEPSLGVSNGDVGVTLVAPGAGRLRVYFLDGGVLRSVPVGRLAHVDTCFAMTIHKSQGSEFAHTVVVLPDGSQGVLSRELVYTAVTRARAHLSMVVPNQHLLAQAVAHRQPRYSGLAAQLAALNRTVG